MGNALHFVLVYMYSSGQQHCIAICNYSGNCFEFFLYVVYVSTSKIKYVPIFLQHIHISYVKISRLWKKIFFFDIVIINSCTRKYNSIVKCHISTRLTMKGFELCLFLVIAHMDLSLVIYFPLFFQLAGNSYEILKKILDKIT